MGGDADAADFAADSLAELVAHYTQAAAVTPSAAVYDELLYARTLLILGLAAAGMGELEEAAAAGSTALECGRVVWPTIILAGKLEQSLSASSSGSAQAEDFRARYAEARTRLALPAAKGSE